jgi:hypothetical protein
MKTIIIPQNNIIFENGPQINPSLEQETMNSLSLSLSLSLVRLNEQKKKKKIKKTEKKSSKVRQALSSSTP